MSQNDFESYEKKLNENFGKYEKQANEKYNNYRDKANAEFAEYMRKSWKAFEGSTPIPLPKSPDPIKQPEKIPNEKPLNEPIPYERVIPIPVAPEQPQPLEPIPTVPESVNDKYFEFDFYNSIFKVRLADNLLFEMPDASEKSVSGIWEKLSDSSYNNIVLDCLSLRDKYNLCDWAYMQMLKHLAISFLGADKENEATLFQIFLLNQSGYRVRMARSKDNKINLLIASDFQIYQYPFYTLGTDKFYLIDSNESHLYIFNQAFPNEKQLSLSIAKEMLFRSNITATKQFSSKRHPEIRVQTSTNKELISFYNAYPKCDWKIYANTPLSDLIKNKMYPTLLQLLSGKSEEQAANILINFVQTAFEYKTDDEQFGYERPFFPDELFYYPYSDCEDRSILFSTLVRDLLKLEVVLLHYPNHLATAVHFDENITGDYLMINDKKFIVCDPTYIGADIGMAMPEFKNTEANVFTLAK